MTIGHNLESRSHFTCSWQAYPERPRPTSWCSVAAPWAPTPRCATGSRSQTSGLEEAVRRSDVIASGVNTYDGRLTCENVAKAHGMAYTDVRTLL